MRSGRKWGARKKHQRRFWLDGAPRSRPTVARFWGAPILLGLSSTDLVLPFWFDFDFHGIEEWHRIRPKGGSPHGELKCKKPMTCTGGADTRFKASTIGKRTIAVQNKSADFRPLTAA